jgi:hypothetical protein
MKTKTESKRLAILKAAADVFREVGFDLEKLLSALAGYGQLQRPAPPGEGGMGGQMEM